MPTEDEKKKKPVGIDLNATPESFANLGQQAMSDTAAVANDPEMRDAFMEPQRTATAANKEALRSQKFKNENAGQRNEISLRTIEAREAAQAKRESQAAAEAQRKADFWNQGKANERPEVREAREARAAEFQQRQDAQRQRMDDRLKPIREAAFARQDAESKRQDDMKDPAKRLAAMRMKAAELGVRINYAELGGPGGKKATYMRPSAEGTEAYLATRGNKNLQNMADQASAKASEMMTPQMPQQPVTGAPSGAMAATNAMAARTPAPAAPMITPQFNPSASIVGPKAPATQPTQPADPNAAAAIASFNQSVAQQPRGSSMAQNANLQNLQQGDIPTLANVPGDAARAATNAVGNFVQEGMQSRPNRVRDTALGIKDVATGKKPLITPRRRSQTAQTSAVNPLLARR